MDFAFSEEQEEFRATLRRFFEEHAPTPGVLREGAAPEGFDPALWKAMAQELGLQGIDLPEAWGGQGFGFLELGIVLEEMGRALVCAPFLSSVVLAAGAIRQAGSEEQRRRLLPAIAAGESVATVALLEGERWEAAEVAASASPDGELWRLEGAKRLVTDGASAGLVVVAARGREGGVGLFAVSGSDPGLHATPLEPLDPTRPLADLELAGARGERLGEAADASGALGRTLDRARIALAFESIGGAARCLEAAVAYAKQRVQFGRPIGSFQAIKHRLAELLLEVECARSAAYWAGWVADDDGADLALAASIAKSTCDEAYLRAAEDNVHVHGGIGVTWEATPHLYLKRAKATETFLGPPAAHRHRIAHLLLQEDRRRGRC